MTAGPVPVQMAVAPAAEQRRVTVFFRVIMLVPHDVVLYFLGLVAGIIAFIGWWGALFTGRLPEFAQTYLAGYIQWSTRVQAYLLLLTDVYPPFSFDDDPGYPVRIAMPASDRLNRLAVFFRYILVFPAALLGAFASIGAFTIVVFVAWLITLFTGKLPTGLHLAYAAILRYQTRINCYFYLLTPTYPGGLFGDGPVQPADAAASSAGAWPPASDLPPERDWAPGADLGAADGPTAPGYAAPGYGVPGNDAPGYGVPGYDAPGYVAPGYTAPGYGVPGYAAAGGYGAPQTSWQPADWRLLLTAGARTLLGWFVGIGVVLWIASIALIAIVAASVKPPSGSVPAGYQRVGGAAQGISVAAPASWVQVNLAKETIQQAAKRADLRGISASELAQMMQSLESLHPVFVLDVAAAVSSPRHVTPNLSAYCVRSGVTEAGSAGVPLVRSVAAAEARKFSTNISQRDVMIGGVPGVQTSYQLSSASAGTLYGSQLEVLPRADKACFVTVTAGNSELPDSVLRVAAATAQFL